METVDPPALALERVLSWLDSSPLVEAVRRASPWMTARQAASYLGISVGTLRNWTASNHIPFSKRGRVVRYHRSAVDQWLAEGSH
jgi:excisionase family DNA binding protein